MGARVASKGLLDAWIDVSKEVNNATKFRLASQCCLRFGIICGQEARDWKGLFVLSLVGEQQRKCMYTQKTFKSEDGRECRVLIFSNGLQYGSFELSVSVLVRNRTGIPGRESYWYYCARMERNTK